MDLWSAIEVSTNHSKSLEDLLNVVDHLPADEKAALAKHLLGGGLNITFGNTQTSGNIIVQINTMDKEMLSYLLTTIADRIKNEKLSE